MHTQLVTVTDQDGRKVPALLILCPTCGGDSFHLFGIGTAAEHSHIQCLDCGHTYCQGGCDNEKRKHKLPIDQPTEDGPNRCPDCETPNQFGELCSKCRDERQQEREAS